MKWKTLTSVITGALALVGAVQAEQGGEGHYLSGATASFIDALPDKPGWILESLFMNYHGTYGVAHGLPYGDNIALNVSADASAYGIGPVLSYMRKIGKTDLIIEAKWLPQLDTQNTTKGNYLWIKAALMF